MKTFPQSVKTVSYVWTATTREKICSSIISKNYTFRGFSQNFSERLVKTAFYLFTAQLWAFDKLLTKILYLITLRTSGEKLSDCGKTARGDWQESLLHVRRKLSVSHTFLKRMFLFERRMGVWAKKHQLFDGNYRKSPSKLFSKCSRQHLDVRCFNWKKNQFSLFFLDFGQKNSTVLSKLPCRFSEPLYEEWYNSGTKSCFLFLHLVVVFETEIFKLRAKVFGWLVKTACYMRREKFWPETIFFKRMLLFETKFGDRAKALRTFGVTFTWQFCRNCFFCVHGNAQNIHTLFDKNF